LLYNNTNGELLCHNLKYVFPHTKSCYTDACIIIDTYHNDSEDDIIKRAKEKIQNETKLCFSEFDGYRSIPTTIKKV